MQRHRRKIAKVDRRKAYPLGRDTAVILQPEELPALAPAASRNIQLCRFVEPALLSDQWYERPYYLGPDGHEVDYFALAEALRRRKSVGIARWVMCKKRYLGALYLQDTHLIMITLQRAEQVLTFSNVDIPRQACRKKASSSWPRGLSHRSRGTSSRHCGETTIANVCAT